MEILVDPLSHPFFVRALVAAVIVGVVCAVIGTFVVLRGIAFMGDAISHAAFPGVVVKGAVATYVAQPGGAPPTSFAATAHTGSAITFENPAHDFPKRVGYQRIDATHLTAWIDGGATGPPTALSDVPTCGGTIHDVTCSPSIRV